jgi:hypothetical protein
VTFDLFLYLLLHGCEELLHHCDMSQVSLYHEPVVVLHISHERFFHLRFSASQPPFAELRHSFRLQLASHEFLDDPLPACAERIGGDGGELDVRILEDLLHPLLLGDDGLDELPLVPGEVSEFANLFRGDEAPPYEPAPQELI